MAKNYSLGIFAVLALLLLALVWLHTGQLVPPSGADAIWFHAGLLTLLVGRFIIEYRFTKPNDVFVNCIVVFASTSTLSAPPNEDWWDILRWGSLVCGVFALVLAWDPGREAKLVESRLRTALYHTVTRLGRAEVIYSLVFVLSLLSYFDFDSAETRTFAIVWGLFLLAANLNVGRIGQLALRRSKFADRKVIGTAHSFLAPSIVFCRSVEGQKASLHEVVGFTQGSTEDCRSFGLIVGQRNSATETRYVVALLEKSVAEAGLSDRSLLVTTSPEELDAANPPISRAEIAQFARLIGTVAKGTNISQLRFEVLGRPQIGAGSLLQVDLGHQSVFYQIFEGLIDEEVAISDSARAFVEGFAEQVGIWDAERGGFATHDWVARECAPVFRIGEDEPGPAYNLKRNEITIGRIPQSNYPVNIDLHDLAMYHAGILGVTGSGKSFLTFQLIEETAARGIKVVCLDPTGDYQKYLHDAVVLDWHGALNQFLSSPIHQIGIIETANIPLNPIEQTLTASKVCLAWCKANRTPGEVLNPTPKALVVLEEAHLLVPEWNFNPERGRQDQVNQTSQIVLQSRKYGLGFLVVAQRTANVVKSVLNQCNTIVSFQAFDETGFDFLRNYMGGFHVGALPNLKPRNGIIVGKASRSRRPVMVQISNQPRELRDRPAPPMPKSTINPNVGVDTGNE